MVDPRERGPLLGCLVALSHIFGKPYSADTLISGLPIEGSVLTPQLFERAAHRAGLSAQLLKKPLTDFSGQYLPATLLLENDQACVLVKIKSNGMAQIIQPEIGLGVINIALSKLDKQYTGYAFSIQKEYRFDDRTEKSELVTKRHWFWQTIKKVAHLYREVLVASFFINMFAIAVPLFTMNVYDRVVPNQAFTTLWVLVFGMTIVLFFEFIMRTLRGYFIDIASKRVDIQLSSAIFEQLLDINMGRRPESVGSMANSLQSFDHFREFISSATVGILIDLPFAILFLVVIGSLHFELLLVLLVLIPILLGTSLLTQKLLGQLVGHAYCHSTEKQAILIESLIGIEAIKSLGAEGIKQHQWENVIKQSALINNKLRILANVAQYMAISIQYLTTISIVTMGVYLISKNELSMGGLIAATILSGRVMIAVAQFSGLLVRYKQSKSSLHSIDQMMKLECDREEGKSYINHKITEGTFELKDVNFRYNNSPIESLKNISFKLNSGEHVGIIGAIGSGKSTLLKLLMNLYHMDSGSILVDNIDIKQIDPSSLRRQIGYIPQQVMLFHGSIRDNITMAANYIEDAAIIKAAELSGINRFINQHPDGFDRQVGERGSLLSGGQQQAIAITRALLLDPPILLFDEPTSSMDTASSKHLIESIHNASKGKTMIVVSHKASVLSLVDRIIVMDNGRIVGDGPKDKILAQLSGPASSAEVDQT